MGIKRVLFLAFLLFSFSLFVPNHTKAASLSEILTSENSILTKITEGVEYFFAFKVENKVQVLEKHAEKRLTLAQEYADKGDEERTQSLIQNYEQIKERQNELLGKTNNGEVLGTVQERTIEQQKTMEQIKTKIDGEEGKNQVIQVQEQVVNQVAKRVVEVNGPEGTTEFLNEVSHVWAPGTGPGGGEAGVVYAGGGKLIYAAGTGPGEGRVVIEGGEMKFAPGTSAGGPSGSDIKNVEVKTGGGDSGSNTVIDSGTQPQNVIDPGTTEPGSDGAQNVIDE